MTKRIDHRKKDRSTYIIPECIVSIKQKRLKKDAEENTQRHSPADRGTKKHVYLRYGGTISFCFYLVPLRLVSIFLNVGRVEISYGLLSTRFLYDITIKLYYCQKR